MLALVHDLARRLWNRRVALAAGVLLLLSVQFTLQARTAQLDALVSLWTTLGLYGLLRHLLLGPDWRWYAAGGFAMGLGIMTKGVGFLPLLVLLPWAWLRWRRPGALPPIDGFVAPVAAGAGGHARADRLLARADAAGELVVGRSGAGGLPRRPAVPPDGDALRDTWTHLRPAWYYLVAGDPWAWLPATLALPWLLPAWRRRLARGDARYWLLLGFVVCVVVFFSLSPGKRGVYLLPALPAFVLAAAPLLAGGLLRRPGLRALCWRARRAAGDRRAGGGGGAGAGHRRAGRAGIASRASRCGGHGAGRRCSGSSASLLAVAWGGRAPRADRAGAAAGHRLAGCTAGWVIR
jgi:4-amino-4-deoxy-L-arabinose transferase-like glycosyltransferase